METPWKKLLHYDTTLESFWYDNTPHTLTILSQMTHCKMENLLITFTLCATNKALRITN